jgi:hypothetical protein
MHRLETTEGKADGRQRRPGTADLQRTRISVGGYRQGKPVNPHGQSIGRRDVPESVEQPVGRIKRRDVALGDQWNTQAQAIAPERQPAHRQGARQLKLERLIHQLGITADRSEAGEDRTQHHPDNANGQKQPGQWDRPGHCQYPGLKPGARLSRGERQPGANAGPFFSVSRLTEAQSYPSGGENSKMRSIDVGPETLASETQAPS